MTLVDSHCHLDFPAYADDREAVLQRAHEAGVEAILAIGIGEDPAQMHAALDLAHQYSGQPGTPTLYASAAIHPQEGDQADEPAFAKLAQLAADPLCIAIGEIGLDYYHADNPTIAVQKSVFQRQMEIAATARLPILIHCRPSQGASVEALAKFGTADAWQDTLDLIETHWRPTGLGGVLHCFTGSLAHARRALDLGFLLSFAGNITYPSAQNIRDAAAFAPADRILVETDAPFLAPIPHRGQRNEPAMVALAAQAVAQARGISPEAAASLTTQNFRSFFGRTRTLP